MMEAFHISWRVDCPDHNPKTTMAFCECGHCCDSDCEYESRCVSLCEHEVNNHEKLDLFLGKPCPVLRLDAATGGLLNIGIHVRGLNQH